MSFFSFLEMLLIKSSNVFIRIYFNVLYSYIDFIIFEYQYNDLIIIKLTQAIRNKDGGGVNKTPQKVGNKSRECDAWKM